MSTDANTLDASLLSKGQMRKLEALRKSLGQEIADDAFARWLKTQAPAEPALSPQGRQQIEAAQRIADFVTAMVETEGLSLPMNGYLVRRMKGPGSAASGKKVIVDLLREPVVQKP